MSAKLVFYRRGGQRLVLFRNPPSSDIVDELKQRGVMIGLALMSQELANISQLDDYSYGIVAIRDQSNTPIAEAAVDLRRSHWSVDVDLGSYPTNGSHIQNTTLNADCVCSGESRAQGYLLQTEKA